MQEDFLGLITKSMQSLELEFTGSEHVLKHAHCRGYQQNIISIKNNKLHNYMEMTL